MPVDWNKPVEAHVNSTWRNAKYVMPLHGWPQQMHLVTVEVDGRESAITVSENTHAVRNTPEPEQGWRYFVANHNNYERYRVRGVECHIRDALADRWRASGVAGGYVSTEPTLFTETDADWKPLKVMQPVQLRPGEHDMVHREPVQIPKMTIAVPQSEPITREQFESAMEKVTTYLKKIVDNTHRVM